MIHHDDPHRAPDHLFLPGDWEFLVPGNPCRLLDGRRTPGVIESLSPQTAQFCWRILDFEDKGKHWDLPVESITSFQFDPRAQRLTPQEVKDLQALAAPYQREIYIEANPQDRLKTEDEVQTLANRALSWLEAHSQFLTEQTPLDLTSPIGPPTLQADLSAFMDWVGLHPWEEMTATQMVLNPESGEWIKGHFIVMAELGLAPFKGKPPRTPDIFTGMGEKEERRRYILHRLAFLRALFRTLNINEVTLYRGMASEFRMSPTAPRTLLSWTFSPTVAQAFADLDDSRFKYGYLIKRTFPIECLFMTYLETRAMNQQYQEAEALVFHHPLDLTL